jgi:uncharacterized protein YjbI with pentapeptide repeats
MKSSPRDRLLALGPVTQLESIIDGLTGAGILRQAAEDDGGRVELRFEVLTRLWPRLRGWIDERLRFRSWAQAWEQSGYRSGTLLFNRTLLRRSDGYGDLNKLELRFKEASSRSFNWTVAGAAAGLIALLICGYVFGDVLYTEVSLYPMRSKERIVKSDSSTSDQKLRAITDLAKEQLKLPLRERVFDFSKAKLVDLNLSGISLVAPNFSDGELTRITFDRDLRNARFSNSEIVDSSFSGAELNFARFDNAKLTMVKFGQARLFRSNFDRAQLCNVEFSGADVREASFKDIALDLKDAATFKDTAWWVAHGWSLDRIDRLANVYSGVKPEEIYSFQKERERHERDVQRSSGSAETRAIALNEMAWTFAIYGAALDQAEKIATEAVNIASNSTQKSFAPEFQDTLAYILQQRGQTQEAAVTLDEALKQMRDPDPATIFKYAVALNGRGREAEAMDMLAKSIGTGYSPSHELYLLRDQITGNFRAKLQDLLNKGRAPEVKAPACSPKQ